MSGTNTPSSDAARTRRAETLRRAAADKHDQAVGRAEAEIHKLLKNREAINFRSVARAAGVSLDFLYSHPELRNRIETLRRQQNPATPARPADVSGDGSVIRTLTESLRRERSANRERVNDLEKRLAAAHGEILRLRRQDAEHGLPD
jgi:hypothetical protein